jgi:hypothetical protein
VKSAEHPTRKPLEWPNYGPVSVGISPQNDSRQISLKADPGKERLRHRSHPLWLATLAVVSMTGCANLSTQTFVKAEVPVNLSEPCPPLPSLDGSVFLWAREVVRMYHECAAKHMGLVVLTGDDS